MLRHLLLLALLLGMSGCGCEPDARVVPKFFLAKPTTLLVKTQFPPIPVAPPPNGPERFRVDVMFVLDDSDQMNDTGLLAGTPAAGTRSQAAQQIMRRLQATIRARLAAAYEAPNTDAGTPPFDLSNADFAFGVARFEDFGGPFTRDRSSGPVDDPNNTGNDEDARPFILNMPILREAHPDFATLFDDAIQREAPGDGNPGHPSVVPGFLVSCPEPQSAIEALYQLTAGTDGRGNGDGTFGGFDGNGDGDTQDSGLPTSLSSLRNPQTLPGSSGDVPAIAFRSLGADDDDQPLYQVQGVVDGVPTDVTFGAEPSLASGNIGGAGWRPDAVKFIVLASDIATAAPMRSAPVGPEDVYEASLGVTLPPGPDQEITSSDGETDAPRRMDGVKTRAFDGGVVEVTSSRDVTERRIGLPGGGVSPATAHTIEDAIAALNALDIEVLLIGAPFAGALSTKPGALGVNGDHDSHVPAYDPSAAVGTPFGPTTSIEPWLWMSAVSRLTTPEVTSEVRPGVVETFPGVYNLATLLRFPEAEPRDTLADDLAERIRAWIDPQAVTGDADSPFKAPLLQDRPPLPAATYDFRLVLGPPSDSGVVGPGELTVRVAIPTYWSDHAAPASVAVTFPGDDDIEYTGANQRVSLPVTATVAFSAHATFADAFVYGAGELRDAATEDTIRTAILARDELVGRASFTVTVREDTDPIDPSRAVDLIEAGAEGCVVIVENTQGAEDMSEQRAGDCPPPNAP